MREQVLWRKVARIIMRLAERLQISPERALAIFYDRVLVLCCMIASMDFI